MRGYLIGRFFVVLLGFPAVAIGASPQKLTYASQQRRFSLVYSQAGLSLFSDEKTIHIPASGCGKKLLDSFWAEAVGEFKRLPASTAKPFLQLNKEKRHVSALDRRARRLADLDRAVFDLQIQERRQCAKRP